VTAQFNRDQADRNVHWGKQRLAKLAEQEQWRQQPMKQL
jgi:hypothetical protein